MKKDVETLQELVLALSEPKATITSVAATGLASVATIGRWKRESRADPDGYTFEWQGKTLSLHMHMRQAARISFARWVSGERPASRPLRHRVRQVVEPDEIEDDPTADAPEAEFSAAEAAQAARVNDTRRVVPASPPTRQPDADPVPVETAMARDLRERVEARRRGEVLPPIVPVCGATPERYVSMDERAEGIGRGEPKPGGFRVS